MKTTSNELIHKAKENETIKQASESTGNAFKRAGTFTVEQGTKVKNKIVEIKVGEAAANTAQKIKTGGMFIGGFLYDKASYAGGKINEKIDSNEKLHNAKDYTKEKVGVATKALASGWNSFYSKITGKE